MGAKQWLSVLMMTGTLSAWPSSSRADVTFIRGDVDVNGRIELTDVIHELEFLFLATPSTLECLEAANVNSDSEVDLADAIYVLFWLFLGDQSPAAPFPNCGIDPAGAPLGCNSSPGCGSKITPIPPKGETIDLQAPGVGQVTVKIPSGVFSSTTTVFSQSGLEKPAQVEDDKFPALPTVRLRLDGMRLNPGIDSETIAVEAPGAFADAAIFIKTSTHEFVYVLPVVPGPGGGDLWSVILVPVRLFNRAREWAVTGTKLVVGATAAVITEVKEGGKVVLDVGGQLVEGTIEFVVEEGKAVVRATIDGAEKVVEITDLTVEVAVTLAFDYAKNIYENATTTLSTIIGEGKLYRVSFSPDITLERVESLESDCVSRTVIVHGVDLFDPFMEAFDWTKVQFKISVPPTEDAVKEKLKEGWAGLLAYLKRSGTTEPYYLYTYNTFLGIRQNGESLAAKLKAVFDWKDRDCPLTLWAHSMGGLVTTAALKSAFNLDNDLPSRITFVTLGTPFRGSPFANRHFQEYWFTGFNQLLTYAQNIWHLLDREAKIKYPPEAIVASLATALTFFLTLTPGARDLDLDALWDITGKLGLAVRLVPGAGELEGTDSCNGFFNVVIAALGRDLLSSYTVLGSQPYKKSDGIVPVASAFRRQGAPDEFWYEDSPVGNEKIFTAHDHLCLADSEEVFSALKTFKPDPRLHASSVPGIMVLEGFDAAVVPVAIGVGRIAVESTGNLVVTGCEDCSIRPWFVYRLSPEGGILVRSGPFRDPDGLGVDASGRIFATDSPLRDGVCCAAHVMLVDTVNGGSDSVFADIGDNSNPNGLGISSTGRMVLVEADGRIREIRETDGQGVVVEPPLALVGNTGAAAAFDQAGKLFVGTYKAPDQNPGEGRLVRVDPDGAVVTIAAVDVIDIACGPGGVFGQLIFATDHWAGRVVTVDETTGEISTFAAGFQTPLGLAFHARNILYVTDQVGTGRIIRIYPKPTPPKEITNSVGMKLVLIPAGSFMMGSPWYERPRNENEGPLHKVNISKGFYIGSTEVTQGDFLSVTGVNPSFFNGGQYGIDLSRPVEKVSWNDAINFCGALSLLEPSRTYRLPTEAEWEYACRASDTITRFFFGDSYECPDDCLDFNCPTANKYMWWCGNALGQTHPVGMKKANSWGLFDVHGNVFEWCHDLYPSQYPENEVTDPIGPSSGFNRVYRGGGKSQIISQSRSAIRFSSEPTNSYIDVGFRVVMVPEE